MRGKMILKNSEKEIEIGKKTFIVLEIVIIHEEMVGKNISIFEKRCGKSRSFEFLKYFSKYNEKCLK
jgi:hypothetical protein